MDEAWTSLGLDASPAYVSDITIRARDTDSAY
jgi:hypothetical protein